MLKLFPEATPSKPARFAALWASLVVAAGTLVSLARTTGAGPLQTIWEEDSRSLLTDALMEPAVFSLTRPLVGYFLLGPRALAEVATLFPISWAAAVLSIEAAVVTALLTLAVYVASGTHLRHPLTRFLVSAPMLFSPTAENIRSEIYNRPATLQFFTVYAVFWLILWVPASRAGRVMQVATIALSAFSTFLVVIYLPLAVLRLWARRDRISLALLGFLGSGTLLHAAGLYFGLTDRAFATPRYEPLWAVKSFVVWAVPHSMLGWKATWMIDDGGLSTGSVLRIAAAWAIALAVLGVAVGRFTRPAWLLAIVAGAHSLGLACMTIMANGELAQRYLLPVEMLLFTALAALAVPSQRRARWLAHAPPALLTAFVLAISAVNYRHDHTWRHKGPLWTEQVRLAAASCFSFERREVTIRSGPAPFYSYVVVPCHVFRHARWCDPPYCVHIGAGRSTAGFANRAAGPHVISWRR